MDVALRVRSARLSHPGKLKLGTVWLLEHQLIARKRHQVNCRRERRFYFDAILITEFVSAANFSDAHGAVTGKFPDRLVFRSRHPPFPDDVGIAATDQNKKQNY